jgi:adenine phosphoribosyltransferase
LIRKKGKLPYQKVTMSYALEYGLAEIEMHQDAIVDANDRVLIHDDLLATGGSAQAAAQLITGQGRTNCWLLFYY